MKHPAAAIATGVFMLLFLVPAVAQEPKVLTYARPAQFESLDPVKQLDAGSSVLVHLTYNSLLTYAYLARPYQLEPDLLEQMPEVAADGVTYTFRLRRGLMFHDDKCFPDGKGREVTVDDVLFSLKRYADANLNHKSWFAMEGAVVGLDDFRAATRRAGRNVDYSKLDIAGFNKLDSHAFTLSLTRKNPLFLFALALSSTAIVPVEAVRTYNDQFGINPVGTGPFILKNAERRGILRFTRNPRYHRTYPSIGALGDAEAGLLKDAGKRLPIVDVIEMPLIEEAHPTALKFRKGELDWRSLERASFANMVRRNADGTFRLTEEFAGKFRIYWAAGLDMGYYAINLKDPVLGPNKVLRQALAHLVDTSGAIETLRNGRDLKLQSIVPIELPGSERDTRATYRDYDLAAAKRLLAAAGFPGGKGLPPFTVTHQRTDSETRNRFDFMKSKFAPAGVQLKPVFMDSPTFNKAVESGNFQIAETGWEADYPDAENFFQLLYSRNLAPGPNVSSFANPDYDKAYEASRYMVNDLERYRLFQVMNDILKEEVPIIIQENMLRFGITQQWVGNFKRNLMAPEFQYLDIDMAHKKKGL